MAGRAAAWCLALALLLAPLCLGVEAEESRAYHGLWGGLFKQQQQAAGGSSGSASSGLHAAADAFKETVAELQSKLLGRLADRRGGSSSGGSTDADGSSGGSTSSPWAALSEAAHSVLLGRAAVNGSPNGGPDGGSSSAGQDLRAAASLDDVLHAHLNLTLSLLDSGANATSLLQRLHDQLSFDWSKADAQLLATIAAMQGWALAALLAGGAAGGGASGSLGSSGLAGLPGVPGGMGGASSGGLEQAAKRVREPAWSSFKPQACLRLQNFGNAEGYHNAMFGGAPCAGPGNAAASADALRWGSQVAFLLDCSKGSGSSSSGSNDDAGNLAASSNSSSSSSSSSSASGGFGGMLHAAASFAQAAASKAAATVAAAMDRSTHCRLSVTSSDATSGASGGGSSISSGSSSIGSAVFLEHTFQRPLIGAPKLDALAMRICNIAPTSQQYPAALARGSTVILSGLKLNGRPVLPAALQVSQAGVAPEGCIAQLYRLNSKATKAGYVLSGWLQLSEGGNSNMADSAASSSRSPAGSSGGSSSGGVTGDGTLSSEAWGTGSGFGVGEMASVEISLGEYSLLDAATSRLLGASAAAQHTAAANAGQPDGAAQWPW